MNDAAACVIVICTIIFALVAGVGMGISASRHNGDNVHKTSVECIKAGKEWRKVTRNPGRSYADWACVEPKVVQ